jgi:5-methylcytosine-specific restriction protein A
VKLVDDDERDLDAEYLVEQEGADLALIMQSGNGLVTERSPRRNPDYQPALAILLERLRDLDAVLLDALVDTQRTKGVPESERKLISGPVDLAAEPNLSELRRTMNQMQTKVAVARRRRASGGNSTRRIRLRLRVPGFGANDADILAVTLASPIPAFVPAFILTWHPGRYQWEQFGYDEAIHATAAGRTWPVTWSVGDRKGGISAGDRALLYRQYSDRGLVASGIFTTGIESIEPRDSSERSTRHGNVEWDVVLDYEDRLPREDLVAEIPEIKWDRLRSSGIEVPAFATRRLNDLWLRHTGSLMFRSPDQPRGIEGQTFPEGAVSRVPVNRYERDRRARKKCLEHWGYHCAVCKFSFEKRYGALGLEFIHVHHLRELSKVPPGYEVDPINDLRPICPNCHAMIHRGPGPALTVEELRQWLQPVE